jgi:hypothetical protein
VHTVFEVQAEQFKGQTLQLRLDKYLPSGHVEQVSIVDKEHVKQLNDDSQHSFEIVKEYPLIHSVQIKDEEQSEQF